MDINGSKLIEQAEEIRIAYEQKMNREAAEEENRIRSKVTNEVHSFVSKWLEELKSSGETEVRKTMRLEDAEGIFSSVKVAREILYGMGLRSRLYKETFTGFLWWKKVVPAWLEIYPAPKNK